MRIKIILTIFLGVFLNANTLEKISDYAINNNYKIISLKHAISSKNYRFLQSKDQLYPQLSIYGSYGKDKYEYRYPQKDIKYDSVITSYNIQLTQPIYRPDIFKMIKDSKLRVKLSKLELEKEKQKILYNLATRYIDFIAYKNILKLQKKRAENFKKILYEIKEKLNYKFVTQSDYLKAKSEYEKVLYDYKETKNIYDRIYKDIKFITNKEDLNLENVEGKFENFSLILNRVSNWQDSDVLINDNVDVKIYKTYYEISKNEYEKRKLSKYPNLDAKVSYSDTDSSDSITRRDNTKIFLELNFKIYNGFYISHYISEAFELYKAAKYDFENQKNSIKIDFNSNIANIKNSYNMLISDKTLIESKKSYLNKIKEALKYNLKKLSDYYIAENDLYYAKLNAIKHKSSILKSYIALLYDINRLSVFELRKLELENIKY